MLAIDGSHGEGGGQIVRTALALSALLQMPFEVSGIRKGRCDSGLKQQHLCCVKALEELCSAKTEGAELGSEFLRFYPGEFKPRTLSLDLGTAGSLTLLMQALLLPAVFASSKVRLKLTGGTDVPWSQPADYFSEVFLPQLRRFAEAEARIGRRGYYPKGGGKLEILIRPEVSFAKFGTVELFRSALSDRRIELLSQGALLQVKGVSHAAKELEAQQVSERQAGSARHALAGLGCPVQISTEYADSLSAGSGIALWAICAKGADVDALNPIRLGSDSLGRKGKRAEEVGREAGERLVRELQSNAPVDSYLADQLLPFLAFSGGAIRVSSITNHCRSNIYVIEEFLGKTFEIDEKERIIRTTA